MQEIVKYLKNNNSFEKQSAWKSKMNGPEKNNDGCFLFKPYNMNINLSS